MNIEYHSDLDRLEAGHLNGFFVGWPNPPSAKTHLRLFEGSSHFIVAVVPETRDVVGFITAITDGVLAAYIPLLEVLPERKGEGIGSELVRRMVTKLRSIYMVDLCCDPDVQPFYDRLGFTRSASMILRNYDRQNGEA